MYSLYMYSYVRGDIVLERLINNDSSLSLSLAPPLPLSQFQSQSTITSVVAISIDVSQRPLIFIYTSDEDPLKFSITIPRIKIEETIKQREVMCYNLHL